MILKQKKSIIVQWLNYIEKDVKNMIIEKEESVMQQMKNTDKKN